MACKFAQPWQQAAHGGGRQAGRQTGAVRSRRVPACTPPCVCTAQLRLSKGLLAGAGLVVRNSCLLLCHILNVQEEDHPVSIQYELGKNGTAAEFALGGI